MAPTAKLIALLLTALSMSVLLGVGSASATAICEDEPIEGECAVPYEMGTELAGKAENSLFEAGSIKVECTKSTIEGEITEEPTGEEEPLAGAVSSLAFSGCSGCETVSALHLPYASSTAWTEEADANTTLQSGGTGEPALKVSACKGGISCVYKASKPVVKFTGGEPGELAAKFELTLVKEESNPSCSSSSAQFSATYVLNQPPGGQAWNARRTVKPTVMCKALEPGCSMTWPLSTTVLKAVNEGSIVAEFNYKEGGVFVQKKQECNSQIVGKAETAGAPLRGKITEIKFTQCTGPCTVSSSRTPYSFQLEAKRNPDGKGDFKLESGGGGPPDVNFSCGTFSCNYEAAAAYPRFNWEIIGGNPAKFTIDKILEIQESQDPNCIDAAQIKGKYQYETPAPLYIEREP